MSAKIRKLSGEDINSSLTDTTRQYLVGDLQRPQVLSHIESYDIEVGITRYPRPTAEQPHSHTKAFEYQYMISGWTQYLDILSGEEHSFRKGDFYMIEPGVVYAQRSSAGTAILFFKVPPGNDKVPAQADERTKVWLEAPLQSKRVDYFNSSEAPRPNSIRPAVAVALFDSAERILLLRRRDNDKWTLPGGTLEFGESLTSCIERETLEETGFVIRVNGLIGTYTDPQVLVAYSDGETRQEFTLVYAGEITGGELTIDDESKEARWFNADEVLQLSVAESQRRRLADVVAYQSDKIVRLH